MTDQSPGDGVRRFDCTSGGAQWCQGCYTMTPDSDGDYVEYADYEKLQNDLKDALDLKELKGPTALCAVVAERDELRLQLAASEAARVELERALIAARPYVEGCYECAFPDEEFNRDVLVAIDAALQRDAEGGR